VRGTEGCVCPIFTPVSRLGRSIERDRDSDSAGLLYKGEHDACQTQQATAPLCTTPRIAPIPASNGPPTTHTHAHTHTRAATWRPPGRTVTRVTDMVLTHQRPCRQQQRCRSGWRRRGAWQQRGWDSVSIVQLKRERSSAEGCNPTYMSEGLVVASWGL
jgi:hypothetical protein